MSQLCMCVSLATAASCVEVDCIYESMDFGGAGNPCGYAPVISIIVDDAGTPGFSYPSWFSGSRIEDPTMTSAAACQALCANTNGCAYFSYELEDQGTPGTPGYVYQQVCIYDRPHISTERLRSACTAVEKTDADASRPSQRRSPPPSARLHPRQSHVA